MPGPRHLRHTDATVMYVLWAIGCRFALFVHGASGLPRFCVFMHVLNAMQLHVRAVGLPDWSAGTTSVNRSARHVSPLA